jgi:hypothetical protein
LFRLMSKVFPTTAIRPAIRFAAKHAVASAVVTAGIVTLTAVSYIALLAWAALTGGGLGGPLALPFLVLFAFVAAIAAAALILFPATALAEWICARREMGVGWQIPVSVACMAACVVAAAGVMSALRGTSLHGTASAAGILFVVLLVPLGVYWWSMQSTDWLLRHGERWWRHFRAAV